ncbi:hypothetical protein VPBB_0836 [Vibrio parahaemolyticus BB22OP]|nr:hypothetical protein VPBB_0836 [Vibrio parahaemolyticus BB22OP]
MITQLNKNHTALKLLGVASKPSFTSQLQKTPIAIVYI